MNQWRKGIAAWRSGTALFLSVPFTWLLADAEALADAHKAGPVIAGGPAVKLAGAPWADKAPASCPFDVLAFHNPAATFTTRGCSGRCSYCAVPIVEGPFRELKRWRAAPVVCDNNLLEASRKHFSKVVASLRKFPASDFNQGLDAGRFTSWHAAEITKLERCKVRFAFDHVRDEKKVADALQTARAAGLRDFGVYCLFGFDDSLDDAVYRLEKVRTWGIRPNPMRFQPLDATRKNAYVAPGWTDYELRRVGRYYSRLRHLEHVPFSDYRYGGEDGPLFEALAGPGRREKESRQ